MKTKQLSFLLVLLCICINTTLDAQNSFDTDFLQEEFSLSPDKIDLRTYDINLDDHIQYSFDDAPKSIMHNDAQQQVAYALSMLAFGAGLGFSESETLWCLKAEYYLRLALLKKSGLYGSAGLGYTGSSGDFFSTNFIDITLKILMFSQLVQQYQQVRLLYGILGQYGFGNYKYDDGFKPDITRLTLGVVVGFQILLSQRMSLILQSNVLSYLEETTKYDGNETKTNSTFGFFNKANIFFLTLAFTLD